MEERIVVDPEICNGRPVIERTRISVQTVAIRTNDQWRICFCWQDGNAKDVEITDCH